MAIQHGTSEPDPVGADGLETEIFRQPPRLAKSMETVFDIAKTNMDIHSLQLCQKFWTAGTQAGTYFAFYTTEPLT
jgi:hypothetical protein